MARDLYDELGVARTASRDEIKRAFKKLAARYHPDKNPGDAGAEARFKAISRAHDVLSDPEKRSRYDEFGADGLREGFNPEAARAYQAARAGGGQVPFDMGGGFGGFGDMLGDLFGGRGGRGRRGLKGADVVSEVVVDFVSAIRGTTVALELHGDTATVRIPPGAADGDKVRVRGKGQPSPLGGPPGDLVLVVRVEPHAHFRRRDLDLELDLPITVGEAHRGAKVPVPTPDGVVSLKVPAHTQSGHVLRLKGKGVERGPRRGDLYVRFLVRLPTSSAEDIDAAIATLEGAMSGDVRDGIAL